jgi:hypothetical protein
MEVEKIDNEPLDDENKYKEINWFWFILYN